LKIFVEQQRSFWSLGDIYEEVNILLVGKYREREISLENWKP
jgi:hypothetical protein